MQTGASSQKTLSLGRILLWTAHASGAELQTQLEVGRRIEIVTEREADMLISDAQEVGRMLFGLVASLERTAR
ncbi:MAG TPA: four helix bundle protein [Thermoanaerobaculia bacterium]|nr:four helix bundle protein [Thermoanaerobaculia bacterium]